MTDCIDLHLHSTYSDGTDSPETLVNLARDLDLKAISITDHDHIGGYAEAAGIMREGEIELVAGVELSCGESGEDIHVLGYLFDPESKVLADMLVELRRRRNQRGVRMLNKLKEIGIDIPEELMFEIAGISAIARPHVADALVKIGVVKNYNEAFDRFIGNDCPGFVPKENISPSEAIELIHESGGLAFLAHPALSNTIRYLEEFVGYGLDGIEVYHSRHNGSMVKRFTRLAQKYNLLISGGSDYHGRDGRYGMIGSQRVPARLLDEMKERVN